MDEAWENWLVAYHAYTDNTEPPLGPTSRAAFDALQRDMQLAQVYYQANQAFARVMAYLSRRWPCVMGPNVHTDRERMRDTFGIYRPFYSGSPGAPPMCGVYTRTAVTVGNRSVPLSVYHMIAPDLSSLSTGGPHTTPDLIAFSQDRPGGLMVDSLLYAAAMRHALAFHLLFVAARDNGFLKIADVRVGGGTFIPAEMHDRYDVKVHNAAIYLLGYGTDVFEAEFPGIRLVPPPSVVPRSLLNIDTWTDVLHVNAWDHSSFVGNGNRHDNTLDGAWGCLAPFAPLAWPYSNPYLRWRAVDTDDLERGFPVERPTDRLCGRPPATLLEKRGTAASAPPEAASRKRAR